MLSSRPRVLIGVLLLSGVAVRPSIGGDPDAASFLAEAGELLPIEPAYAYHRSLASDPVLMADLMTIEVDESLNVRFDEDVCSLYSLLTILAAVGSPTRAAEVARGWVAGPRDSRGHGVGGRLTGP